MVIFGLYVYPWLHWLLTHTHTRMYIMHLSCTLQFSHRRDVLALVLVSLWRTCVCTVVIVCMHCSPHSVPVQQCASGEIANGVITDQLTDNGEQVQSLTCDAGYEAVGGVTERECNHTTGNWNAPFSCEG